jgi:hypothetical protein
MARWRAREAVRSANLHTTTFDALIADGGVWCTPHLRDAPPSAWIGSIGVLCRFSWGSKRPIEPSPASQVPAVQTVSPDEGARATSRAEVPPGAGGTSDSPPCQRRPCRWLWALNVTVWVDTVADDPLPSDSVTFSLTRST